MVRKGFRDQLTQITTENKLAYNQHLFLDIQFWMCSENVLFFLSESSANWKVKGATSIRKTDGKKSGKLTVLQI